MWLCDSGFLMSLTDAYRVLRRPDDVDSPIDLVCIAAVESIVSIFVLAGVHFSCFYITQYIWSR